MEPETSNGSGSGMVALTIPARPEFIALCRLALTGLARTRALPQELLADMKLALTEACSNSVRHAYDQGHEGQVAIRYELGEGGLVIAIIRAVTDEFEIARGRDGQGSRLRFVKYLG